MPRFMASKRPVSQLTGFTVHGNHETVADMLSVMMMFHHRRARAPVNTANAWTLPYHQGISMIWSTYGNFTCVLYYKDVAFRVYLTMRRQHCVVCIHRSTPPWTTKNCARMLIKDTAVVTLVLLVSIFYTSVLDFLYICGYIIAATNYVDNS